jgi:hypothetical protein
LAAGAILPPLFFERRRDVSIFAPRERHSLKERPNNMTASITRLNGRRAYARPLSDRSPPKDI